MNKLRICLLCLLVLGLQAQAQTSREELLSHMELTAGNYANYPVPTGHLTPPAEIEKLRAPVETFFITRDRGAGRPTKKDRRDIEEAWDAIDFNDIPDDVAAHFGLSDDDLEQL